MDGIHVLSHVCFQRLSWDEQQVYTDSRHFCYASSAKSERVPIGKPSSVLHHLADDFGFVTHAVISHNYFETAAGARQQLRWELTILGFGKPKNVLDEWSFPRACLASEAEGLGTVAKVRFGI